MKINMNKKDLIQLVKQQGEDIKSLKTKCRMLERALDPIRSSNERLAGEPEPKAATQMRELAEAVTRDKPVLSGNERIKKLLEKQKFVMVMVSDYSYEDALDDGYLRVCRDISSADSVPTMDVGCVLTTDVGCWIYGIPVDNNGNEITEV